MPGKSVFSQTVSKQKYNQLIDEYNELFDEYEKSCELLKQEYEANRRASQTIKEIQQSHKRQEFKQFFKGAGTGAGLMVLFYAGVKLFGK